MGVYAGSRDDSPENSSADLAWSWACGVAAAGVNTLTGLWTICSVCYICRQDERNRRNRAETTSEPVPIPRPQVLHCDASGAYPYPNNPPNADLPPWPDIPPPTYSESDVRWICPQGTTYFIPQPPSYSAIAYNGNPVDLDIGSNLPPPYVEALKTDPEKEEEGNANLGYEHL